MTIKICVSVPPHTVSEALDLIQTAESEHPDFIEVRLDSLDKHSHLADITNCSNTPLIATNRSTRNRGDFSGSEAQRKKILFDAAENGFDFIDIELSTPKLKEIINSLREIGVKPVVSFHNFDETPSTSILNKILKRQVENEAYVCKIVTTAKTVEDNLIMLNFVAEACKTARVVCFSMGDIGRPSRLLSSVFGAFFTIAALDRERKTASGQLTIQQMKMAYRALGLI